MRTYIIGTFYEFVIKFFYTTTDDNGYDRCWFALSDGESELKYNVPAYPFQKEGFEGKKVLCQVTKIVGNGYPYLRQDRNGILEGVYTPGKKYAFEVQGKDIDSKTNDKYYNLYDAENHLCHRFYSFDELEEGGAAEFVVKQIVDTHLELQLCDTGTTHYPQHNPFGHEDSTHEWKSSFVFPAGTLDPDNPDVEAQMRVIMKSIAGLQNAEGGVLYLGVTDNGRIRGIEEDYPFLNGYDNDKCMNYKADTDGYENKIRAKITYYLGKTSLENTSFRFYLQKTSQRIFCVITVSKTSNPIFLTKRIFKRFGNGYRELFNDEITELAINKHNDTTPQQAFAIPMPDDCVEYNPNVSAKVQKQEVIRLGKNFINKMNYYYLSFFDDKTIKYSTASSSHESGFVTEVRFNNVFGNLEYSRDILVKYTKDGCVHFISCYAICKLGKEDTRIQLNAKEYDNILGVKIAHKYDFLKATFELHGEPREKYIRVVSLFNSNTEESLVAKDVDIKYQFTLKGVLIIPRDGHLLNIEVIHESLPDEIRFVSPLNGSVGIGSKIGDPNIDTSKY